MFFLINKRVCKVSAILEDIEKFGFLWAFSKRASSWMPAAIISNPFSWPGSSEPCSKILLFAFRWLFFCVKWCKVALLLSTFVNFFLALRCVLFHFLLHFAGLRLSLLPAFQLGFHSFRGGYFVSKLGGNFGETSVNFAAPFAVP